MTRNSSVCPRFGISVSALVLQALVMANTCAAWILPVSSPIMSLPIIESSTPVSSSPSSASIAMSSMAQSVSPEMVENEHAFLIPSQLWERVKRARTTIRRDPTAATTVSDIKIRKVFCDLDGVLVDFESGIRDLFPPETKILPQLADLERSTMWKSVQEADSFFEHLGWTPEGKKLWEVLQPWNPDILTGIPHVHPSARAEKMAWCQRELGTTLVRPVKHCDKACPWTFGHRPTQLSVGGQLSKSKNEDACKIITCWSRNKHFESGPGHVLIDDRESLRKDWEAKGGIFVHHQPGNLGGTLEQLRAIGML